MFWKTSQGKKLAKRVYALWHAFTYKSEAVETSFSAKQMLARGGGDCDDAERLWHDTLDAIGFEPVKITGYLPSGEYHAACVCDIDGTEYVFCNATGRLTTIDRYTMTHMTEWSDAMYASWRRQHEWEPPDAP